MKFLYYNSSGKSHLVSSNQRPLCRATAFEDSFGGIGGFKIRPEKFSNMPISKDCALCDKRASEENVIFQRDKGTYKVIDDWFDLASNELKQNLKYWHSRTRVNDKGLLLKAWHEAKLALAGDLRAYQVACVWFAKAKKDIELGRRR